MPGYRKPREKSIEITTNLTLTMEDDPSDDEDDIVSLSVLSNKLRQFKSLPSLSIIPSRFEIHDQACGEATMRERLSEDSPRKSSGPQDSSGCFMYSIADTFYLQFKKIVCPLK